VIRDLKEKLREKNIKRDSKKRPSCGEVGTKEAEPERAGQARGQKGHKRQQPGSYGKKKAKSRGSGKNHRKRKRRDLRSLGGRRIARAPEGTSDAGTQERGLKVKRSSLRKS